MADYSLAQIPNFAASALGGFQAGQAMGKQKLVQSALSGVDLTRPETITPLLKVDPEHGIALLGASTAMLKNEREIAAREATTNYLAARFAPKPASAGVSTDGTAVSSAAPIASITAPATTPTNSPDLSAAEHALMQVDPQGYLSLRESVDKMDETQRAHLVTAQNALHEAAAAVAQLPYADRKAYLTKIAPDLAAHYVTPDQIANFDPTDQNLAVVTAQALGVKGVADRADKRAALTLAQQKEAREARQGDARIGIAKGALKVAQDRAAKAGTGTDVSGDDTAALLAAAGL